MRRTRNNPIVFDDRFEMTPELRESIRVTKDRSLASALAPATHRAIERETASSPHNFRVVIVPRPSVPAGASYAEFAATHRAWERKLKSQPTRKAVTLLFAPSSLASGPDTPRSSKAGLFSAFTYLHRLGDQLADPLFRADADFLRDQRNENALPLSLRRGYPLDEIYSDEVAVANIVSKKGMRSAVEKAYANRKIFEQFDYVVQEEDEGRRDLHRYIETHINSKMVREGYSSDFNQSLADLFPLCEFTPPSRPLFLPFDKARMSVTHRSAWDRNYPKAVVDACNAYGAEMNVRFRDLYNTLIPALYGSVWNISD